MKFDIQLEFENNGSGNLLIAKIDNPDNDLVLKATRQGLPFDYDGEPEDLHYRTLVFKEVPGAGTSNPLICRTLGLYEDGPNKKEPEVFSVDIDSGGNERTRKRRRTNVTVSSGAGGDYPAD